MTHYRLTKPHYLRTGKPGETGTEAYVEAGQIIEWSGPPTLGMEGVDDEGRAKCKERDEKRQRSTERAIEQGQMSRLQAENLGPKTEPLSQEEQDEDDENQPHRTRRPKGR